MNKSEHLSGGRESPLRPDTECSNEELAEEGARFKLFAFNQPCRVRGSRSDELLIESYLATLIGTRFRTHPRNFAPVNSS